jgi:hypothetical protein
MSSLYPRNTYRSFISRKFDAETPGRGRSWYVDSAKGGYGDSPKHASATLQAVIDRIDAISASDNRGDTIYVLPNHSETITGAGGLTFDVPGLRVVGLGHGSQRPQFLMDAATTVTAVVNAADTYIENLVFVSGHSDVATCFDVDATGFTCVNCEFRDNTTHENFLVGFTMGSVTDNVVDDFHIEGCVFTTATGSHTAFISALGRTKRPKIIGNRYVCANHADAAGQFIAGTAGDDWWDAVIAENMVHVTVTATDTYPFLNGNVDTDNTGIIVRNFVMSSISNTNATNSTMVKALGFRYAENYGSGADLGGGVLWPTATEGS